LFFAVIVVIAEIGLATGLVLRRLTRLERLRELDRAALDALRETRPPAPDRFAWLKQSMERTNVFITFVVASGVLVSSVAWLADRIAARTSTPAAEQELARALSAIRYPSGGLLLDDVTVLAQDVPGASDDQIRKLLRHGGHGS
jgi:hypothetical protein